MSILIKNARLIAPGQPSHGKIRSLLIEDGIIVKIAKEIEEKADQTIAYNNLHLSPGWMDPFAHFCDPGLEYKETLATGATAAAKGGYTSVFTLPNTQPALDSRTQIEYIRKRSEYLPIRVYPIGAISKDTKGENLAEMYDMFEAGAPTFSDGLDPVQSSGLMLKALQYVKAFEGIIIQIPEDQSLSQFGLVHEGLWSTMLGIKGKPDLAELMMIKRDIDLLKYTDSKLHLTGISLAASLKLIKEAKEEGLELSCSIAPYNLLLTDQVLQNFDSNYKLTPPLREQQDVDALIEGLKSGVIDCLASHHIPQDIDSKDREFEYAGEGMIGLETAFGILGKALPELTAEDKVNILAIHSRNCFGLEIPQVKEGEKAELTLFDPEVSWKYNRSESPSKSRNTPFNQMELKGKPLGVIYKKNLFLNPS